MAGLENYRVVNFQFDPSLLIIAKNQPGITAVRSAP